MGIFSKWWGSIFGAMGDHVGWQATVPMATTVPNTHHYTPEKAVQIPTVWACVELLSHTMATLPCDVFTKQDNGQMTVDTHCNLHRLLSESPNSQMTPFEFWQTMTMYWALRGNAYALISRNRDRTARALYPLNPDQMEVFFTDDGRVVYQYHDKKDRIIEYKAGDIMHWKCMGNGIVGMSKLEFMRASIDESAKAQTNAVSIFADHGKMNGILSAATLLNDKQKIEIAKQFQAARSSGGIPVLPATLTFQQLSLSPADTELLETRKFSVEEICRWFGVPSALINSTGGAAGSNIEQVTANFYKQTILPMCISAEQALMKKVACIDEKLKHQVHFRLSFLNKANDKDRYAMNAQAVQNGWKTRNEVRLEEGLPPVEGGDELTAQNNLMPLDKLGTVNPTQTPQTALTQEPIRQ